MRGGVPVGQGRQGEFSVDVRAFLDDFRAGGNIRILRIAGIDATAVVIEVAGGDRKFIVDVIGCIGAGVIVG